jgi:hypothetical protein
MTPAHVTRHALWVAAVLLMATALLAPVWPEARISVASGEVELGRGEPPVWKPAASGDTLAPGDRVRTGENGRAELALGDATLRLYPNSLLRLPAPGADAAAVELDGGSSLFDVLRRSEPFEVRTPEVVVSVKGTRFAVEVGADARVSVFQGLVGVRDGSLDAASEVLVQAGFAALGSDHLELTWHGAADPWDGWSRGEHVRDLDLGRGLRRDDALRDARAAAQEMARELPHPAARDPEGEGRGVRRRDGKPEAGPPQDEPKTEIPRDSLQQMDPELGQKLEESFIESLLNDPDASTDPSGGLFQIVFQDGSGQSGPDAVQIVTDQGTWTFEQDDVEAVLDGDAALPSNLTTLIESQGLTDTELASQLMRLFD